MLLFTFFLLRWEERTEEVIAKKNFFLLICERLLRSLKIKLREKFLAKDITNRLPSYSSIGLLLSLLAYPLRIRTLGQRKKKDIAKIEPDEETPFSTYKKANNVPVCYMLYIICLKKKVL